MPYPYPKKRTHIDKEQPSTVPAIDDDFEAVETTTLPKAPPQKLPPTGARLRGLAFAMLGRREYSEQEFRNKLLELEANPEEVAELVQEFKTYNYQSDQRMAQMIVRANIRKGRGPARVKQTLRERHVNLELATEDMIETDWLALARALRIKKFGVELPTEPKEKARQLRFLQYRGFDGQTCSKAVMNSASEED
ncbi:regulatory protein RecX [Aquirhabdus parva]|uniref:Regulatory protein RecX n=1 Tax=Aquirhabdus parva TaxID=2283318 RepID=A0A345P4I6_9GAMM|nr:regulatory protein RecX [Aquirhabdus parva]AXI02195.1 regulatory protein RecX [Aquirhabdus parva]